MLLNIVEPGAPRGFTLLQTNTTCLNISWIAPTSTGGIIEAYDVSLIYSISLLFKCCELQ